jgi:UMF1 family MFS transporter
MGVQTIMLVAALFGKKILNIPTPSLILIILIIQLVAIPGALLIAKISDSIGNFKTLLIVILAWVFICLSSYFITSQTQFFVLAFVVGFVMGGVQSLSRSTYAKLIPSNRDTTSFFSFFDVTEKIAIAIGLLSYGFIEEFSGSMRKSTLVVMMYFIIGLIILLPLYNKKIGT